MTRRRTTKPARDFRPLTTEERQRGFAALTELGALQATVLAENEGVPFSSSVEIIHQMRDKRSDELDQR